MGPGAEPAADDLPLWVAAFQDRTNLATEAWCRNLGITRRDWDACLDAIPRVLDGGALTREALAREVAQRIRQPVIEAALLDGWGGVLKQAAWRGQLCFGPLQRRDVTFVEPHAWLKRHRVK